MIYLRRAAVLMVVFAIAAIAQDYNFASGATIPPHAREEARSSKAPR